VSLRDQSGRNIFGLMDEQMKDGGRKDAAYDDVKFISQEAEWFLAGLLLGLPDGESLLRIALTLVVPMMCPTINSYKRLLGGEVSLQSRLAP
jgi:glutamine synthetase